MSHDIMENDQVLLHAEPAWHGLGLVVKDAPTCVEAQRVVLNWTALGAPLFAGTDDGDELYVDTHKLIYRSDTKEQLGIVTSGWTPIQPLQMAEFCDALAEQGDVVKVDTAGSIRNGRKIWFLLKGESFSVRGKDEVRPYILASNGFDGGTAFRLTPTNIRVVCKNTMSMVIPVVDANGKMSIGQPAAFVAHHTASISERIEEAKTALQLYGRALTGTRELIDQLAAKDVKREDVQAFFLECYTRDFGAFPANPKNKIEQNSRTRAMDACNAVFQRFDDERELAGTTAWGVFNAYTGYLQNDRHLRGKDPERVAERKIESKLFGVDSERTLNALATALAI